MHDAGLALNATFKGAPVAGWVEGSGSVNTTVGVPIVIELPSGGGEPFDYVVSMEDLHFGQRIMNYSFEFQVRSERRCSGGAVPPLLSAGCWLRRLGNACSASDRK